VVLIVDVERPHSVLPACAHPMAWHDPSPRPLYQQVCVYRL
jgi:hypothetical protein